MNTTNNTHLFFLVGFLVGFFGFALLMSYLGATPTNARRAVYQQAIDLHYGKWVVNTNYGPNPVVCFEWITNTVAK